jgi:glycosyltransferase involved in cell wall biosynthesis
MRAAIVTGIFPPDIGGPASYVALLGESLCSSGWKIEVITYSSGRPSVTCSFPVHRISRSIPLPLRLVITLFKTLRAAAAADLIYCNGLILPSAVAGLLLRKPLVTKLEGDLAWERATNLNLTSDPIVPFQTRPQNWKVRILKAIRNWGLRRSRVVITTSRFLERLIQGWGYSGPIEVISNAVEEAFGRGVAEATKEQCRAEIGFPHCRIVISVGRLVSWKGFPRLILAAKALRPEENVLILGDGPEKTRLAAQIKANGLGDKVFLMGRIHRNRLPVYLKAADCLVLNSAYESFPHVLLEAMKMGTPVVAAKAAGMPELIEDGKNGFLFDKDDVSQIVSRVNECLHEPAVRDRLVAEASKRLSNYAWSRILPQTLSVLEKAAGRPQ